jgi:hypothetical protein
MMETLNDLQAAPPAPYSEVKWTFEGLKGAYVKALGL